MRLLVSSGWQSLRSDELRDSCSTLHDSLSHQHRIWAIYARISTLHANSALQSNQDSFLALARLHCPHLAHAIRLQRCRWRRSGRDGYDSDGDLYALSGKVRQTCLYLQLHLWFNDHFYDCRGFRVITTFVYIVHKVLKKDVLKIAMIITIFFFGFSQGIYIELKRKIFETFFSKIFLFIFYTI